MIAFFCAVSIVSAEFNATKGDLGVGLLITVGAIAIWIAMAICRIVFPRHSRGWLATLVALALGGILVTSRSAVTAITYAPAIAMAILSAVHSAKEKARIRKLAALDNKKERDVPPS